MNERIHKAYQGELYGIAFFSHFAANYRLKECSQLWHCLIQVETLTANLLEKSLDRLQVPYLRNDLLMQSKGIADADVWINLPWFQLIETLVNWVQPYEEQYRFWVSESSTEFDTFQLITAHETAIYDCCRLEQTGQSGIPTLLKFIEQYQANSVLSKNAQK